MTRKRLVQQVLWLCCTVLLCGGAGTAWAQQAVVPLRVEVEATTDWLNLELRGLRWRLTGRKVEVGGATTPEVRVSARAIAVRKPPLDLTPVRVTLDLAAVVSDDVPQLIATRGDLGKLTVRVLAGGRLLTTDTSAGRGRLQGNQRLIPLPIEALARVSALPRRDWGRRLLAFYYGWWGTPDGPAGSWAHWDPQASHHAVNRMSQLGMYDSADPKIIAQHVAWAKEAGIDTLVLSLWKRSPHQDLVMRGLLDAAQRAGLTVAAYMESCDDPDDLRKQIEGLLRDFGQHPAWLTVQGQKVLFIYTRIFKYVDAVGFRKALLNLPVMAIGDRMEPEWLDVLGGLHSYVSFISPANTSEELRIARQAARLHDKLAVATIMPGYDDTAVRFPGRHIPREEGRYLLGQWRAAALADWIILTSFNELHEGSQIEPTTPEADETLAVFRRYVDAWKQRAPSPTGAR